MLSKDKRLNLKTDFKWVASGKTFQITYFKLFVRYSDQSLNPKIGVAVSTKVFKNAVDRNKAKRLIFAAFEMVYVQLPVTINIIALPNSTVLDVKSVDIAKELELLLNKL